MFLFLASLVLCFVSHLWRYISFLNILNCLQYVLFPVGPLLKFGGRFTITTFSYICANNYNFNDHDFATINTTNITFIPDTLSNIFPPSDDRIIELLPILRPRELLTARLDEIRRNEARRSHINIQIILRNAGVPQGYAPSPFLTHYIHLLSLAPPYQFPRSFLAEGFIPFYSFLSLEMQALGGKSLKWLGVEISMHRNGGKSNG